ncbi:MAG: Rrf2 family transcriptional regulator [Deltaproteobacteria bacterium]|nr:Rrf2 family transcriptional regulator [Deltaproteobacteria bacterium]
MKFTTKTEYGLISLIHMAGGKPAGRITTKEVAELEKYSPSYIEKIFQGLRDAGIVTSHQGNQGGYALARPTSEITLKQIIDALEGDTFDLFCSRDDVICNHSATLCGLKEIWRRTKELLDAFYSGITLEMIVRSPNDIGIKVDELKKPYEIREIV